MRTARPPSEKIFVEKNGRSRETAAGPCSNGPPICMATLRNFTRRPYRCGVYEAQNVLDEIDDVDLICLEQDLIWSVLVVSKLRRMVIREKESNYLIHASNGA